MSLSKTIDSRCGA